MKKASLKIDYTIYESVEELDSPDRELLKQAEEAMGNAYAPYSQFYVGSAVLLSNGEIIKGNNQENVAYPAGLCAERVAMFAASANYPDENIKAIAIFASAENFEVTQPVSPCGSCRQVMAEYETKGGEDIRVLLGAKSGKVISFEKVSDLLPLTFFEDKLKQ